MRIITTLLILFYVFSFAGCDDDDNTNNCTPTLEECDGIDNDCDGEVDEELTQSCGNDCGPGLEVCVDGAWVECTAPQPDTEVCDGVDNDCDGAIDNGFDCIACDSRLCGTDVGICEAGTELCDDSCQWSGSCDGEIVPTEEVCDSSGLDENCDGSSNEECSCIEGETSECCGADPVSCDDGSFPSCPTAPDEVCNSIDDNCDGIVDNGIISSLDSYEPNETCTQAYYHTTELLPGNSLSFVATNYHDTPIDDIDYYVFSAGESEVACMPYSSQCYSLEFSVIDPTGGDVDFDVIVVTPDDISNPAACDSASPGDANYLSSTDTTPEDELTFEWEGVCGLDDTVAFYVVVFSDSGINVCTEYTLNINFSSDDSCS